MLSCVSSHPKMYFIHLRALHSFIPISHEIVKFAIRNPFTIYIFLFCSNSMFPFIDNARFADVERFMGVLQQDLYTAFIAYTYLYEYGPWE